jgi:Uma2 family endonuclease
METRMIAEQIIRRVPEEIEYPSSDGQPMAETGIHAQAMVLLKQALEDLLAKHGENAYIAIDMFWYWEKGNPKACKAPDLMVILGAAGAERDSFKSWEEGGRIPNVIFEVASKNTWREDVGEKKAVYQRLGVQEYFIFDPLAEFIRPTLLGYRLRSSYSVEYDDGAGLISDVLQARLVSEGPMLRVFDLQNQEPILTRSERIERERQRTQQESQRAEQERQRAEQERQRAEQERQRADSLENENARLRNLLRKAGLSEQADNETKS